MNIVKKPEFTQEDIDLCVKIMDMVEAIHAECDIDEIEVLGRKVNLNNLWRDLDIFTDWADGIH